MKKLIIIFLGLFYSLLACAGGSSLEQRLTTHTWESSGKYFVFTPNRYFVYTQNHKIFDYGRPIYAKRSLIIIGTRSIGKFHITSETSKELTMSGTLKSWMFNDMLITMKLVQKAEKLAPPPIKSIYAAATFGDVHYIEQYKNDVNQKDKDGVTALMYAAASPYPQAVIALLKRGANVHIIYQNIIKPACDPKTMHEVKGSLLWQADNQCLYYEGSMVRGGDPNSFKVLNTH